jgi:Zn-dependent M28 family amino/carboxypeptidase
MQVATALSRARDLAHDVAFLLFGGEEQGLLGSRYFVENLPPADRARIAGVVNIDMAGSKNTAEPSVLLEGAPLSQAVINQLASAAATYTDLETQVSLNPYASDHVPFIDAGIPAVLTIEGADSAYAHEHTARDVPNRVDFELHRQITMMDLAWLATEAMPKP